MTPLIDIHSHDLGESPDILKLNSLSIKDIYDHKLEPNSMKNPFTVGIHPWHVDLSLALGVKAALQKFLNSKLCIGIGEIGLDRARMENYPLQTKVFKEQVLWAKEQSQNFLVLHCVRAQNDILSILKEVSFEGQILFHDYNGSIQEWKALSDLGYLVSLGPKIRNSKTKAYKLLQYWVRDCEKIPWGQFFLETDASALNIKELYEFLSQITHIQDDELRSNFAQNLPISMRPFC